MTSIGGNVVSKFRSKFRIPHKEALHWFPGHMNKGLKQMQQQLKSVDCVIEVHDARVPISGRNLTFKHTVTGLKPHIFVLNKADLADDNFKEAAKKRLELDGISRVLHTNFKSQSCPGMKQLLPLATKLIQNSNRYNRSTETEYSMMIIGVPNVGKSSLINRLRNRYLKKANATAVGAIAGITRSVLTRIKISENPPVYLLDTPGVLMPNVQNVEAGLKLALVGCLQDHLVGVDVIADYLLYWLNKHERFQYVEKLGLTEPCDDILEVLSRSAVKLQKMKKLKHYDGSIVMRPDLDAAAYNFLKLFRVGAFGPVCLDDDLLTKSSDDIANSEE